MYESETAAKKLIAFMDEAVRYKARYIKNCGMFKNDNNLSERQIRILITLSIYEKDSVSEMAKFMNISKSTLSIILSKMIKKGFVTREYPGGDGDKRKTYFKITNEGIDQLKALGDSLIEGFRTVYESFSCEKKKDFFEGVKKLSDSIKALKTDFYNIAVNSEFYKEISASDEVSAMAVYLYLFFICFAEYYESILKERIKINYDFKALTRNRYNILHCIEYFGFDTVSKLEEYLCQSGSAVSIAVSKLVKEGYLYKEYPSGDEDGRIVYIRLTKKGFEIIDSAKKGAFEAFTMYFDEFSEEQRKNAIEALKCLSNVFAM